MTLPISSKPEFPIDPVDTFLNCRIQKIVSAALFCNNNNNNNNKKRSHTQLDSRKQVIAFQDRVITINIKEAQHPLK